MKNTEKEHPFLEAPWGTAEFNELRKRSWQFIVMEFELRLGLLIETTNRKRVTYPAPKTRRRYRRPFIRSSRYYDVILRTYDVSIGSLLRQTALNLTQIGFAFFSRQCKFDTFVFSYLFIFFEFVLGLCFASRRAECVDRQLQRFKFHAVAPQFYRSLVQVVVKVQSFQFVSHTARQLLSGPRDPDSSSRF